MVCFDISIAYPLQRRYQTNILQEEKISHMIKYHNGDFLGGKQIDNEMHIRVAICDEDAVGFLRDIPAGAYCLQIKDLHKNTLLYSFWKVTNVEVLPPRYDLILKKVYWSASQLERRRGISINLPEVRHVSF
jgi:hypothetical protein